MWTGPQETLPGSQGPQPRERLAMLQLTKNRFVSGSRVGEVGARGPRNQGGGLQMRQVPSPQQARALLLVSRHLNRRPEAGTRATISSGLFSGGSPSIGSRRSPSPPTALRGIHD